MTCKVAINSAFVTVAARIYTRGWQSCLCQWVPSSTRNPKWVIWESSVSRWAHFSSTQTPTCILSTPSSLSRFSLRSHPSSVAWSVLQPLQRKKPSIEVLRSLRKQGNSTPVLLLTAKSEVDDKIKGLDIGADDYLTKPFVTGELLARLRAITRRGNEIIGDELRVGNTTLDKNTHELCGKSGSVKLAAKMQMDKYRYHLKQKAITYEFLYSILG